MAATIQRGGNAAVEHAALTVAVGWSGPSDVDADASAYLLTENGVVRGDHDMVFYNQPSGGAGAVSLRPGQPVAFDIEPRRLPPEVAKVVFCLTIRQARARGQSFASLAACAVTVSTPGGAEQLRFEPITSGASEAAMVLGELYRRAGVWKFRAVGQGFDGGLGPLARSFGITVDELGPEAPSARSEGTASPHPATTQNLSKISLEKKGQSISLEKQGSSFGEVTINLNWSRRKAGLFSRPVDLDVGCLWEMQDKSKGVVQALGNAFGDYAGEPFIELSGDDRTGDAAAGETIRINGGQWAKIRRVAVFALIYDGAPNWQATNGVVTIEAPGQPPIEVRMTEGRNDRRLCGIALLENDWGALKVTRIVDYYPSQSELDRAYGWGMRWVAGSKD